MILGGHGITAWGATSDEAERNSSRGSSRPPRPTSTPTAIPAAVRRRRRRAPAAARRRAPEQGGRARAAPAGGRIAATTAWSATSPTPTSCSSSSPARSCSRSPSSARRAPTTSCARRSSRSCSTSRRRRRWTSASPGSHELHEQYRTDYAAYYERHADADSPPMRGADPAIVLVPGVGMFSYGKDKQTARVAGEFYVNAINVMRGAEALSTLRADPGVGEVPHRVLGARGGQAAAAARRRSATPAASRSSPAPPAASARAIATRLAADGACVVVADLDADTAARGRRRARQPRTSPSACGRRHRCGRRARRGRRRAARVRRDRPRREQRRAVDLQAAARDDRARLGPAARRDGQGQLPRRPGGGAGR